MEALRPDLEPEQPRTTVSFSEELVASIKPKEDTMVDRSVPGMEWLGKFLADAEPDVVRDMLKRMVEHLMSAEVDGICGAGCKSRSEDRVNTRNGYRARPWDTRAGSIELSVPKLRHGSYFPDWLPEPRRRAERALVTVIAEAYVAGVSSAERAIGGFDINTTCADVAFPDSGSWRSRARQALRRGRRCLD